MLMQNTAVRLAVIGPPGSGKGTQAKRICERLGYLHVSTGEMVRDEYAVAEKLSEESLTPTQRRILESTYTGMLVEDDVMLELVEKVVRKRARIIFDGFPRTLNQARQFELDLAIFIDLDPELCIERILKRGEARSDDDEKIARIRLETYRRETLPLVEYYENMGILISIDGNQEVSKITDLITESIKSF